MGTILRRFLSATLAAAFMLMLSGCSDLTPVREPAIEANRLSEAVPSVARRPYFPEHDPLRRPHYMPYEFPKRPWLNRIPLLQDPKIGIMSSDFGWRRLRGRKDFHGGVDIITPKYAGVVSTVWGQVVHTNRRGYRGGLVIAASTGRLYTYWHVYPLKALKIGDQVSPGELIGRVAPYGKNTHLHYAIHNVFDGNWKRRNDRNAIDPMFIHSVPRIVASLTALKKSMVDWHHFAGIHEPIRVERFFDFAHHRDFDTGLEAEVLGDLKIANAVLGAD